MGQCCSAANPGVAKEKVNAKLKRKEGYGEVADQNVEEVEKKSPRSNSDSDNKDKVEREQEPAGRSKSVPAGRKTLVKKSPGLVEDENPDTDSKTRNPRK
jgi:hypothetical protein